MAIVCFSRESGKPIDRYGYSVVEALRRSLGFHSELKYRKVIRALEHRGIALEDVVEMVLSSIDIAYASCRHVEKIPYVKIELLIDVLSSVCTRGSISIAVLDEDTVPGRDRVLGYVKRVVGCVSRIRFGSSKKFYGIQLADFLAGLCRDRAEVCLSRLPRL